MAKKKLPDPNPSPATAFAVGDKVRVKPGTVVPEMDDIPMGGWAGKITEIETTTNTTLYLIAWNRHTLSKMPKVYHNRCDRDGMGVEDMWLGGEDITPDDGSPPVIEQPKELRTRPLNLNEEEDRIRAVFGLTSDDLIPEVDEKPLKKYYKHLKKTLKFPFEGSYELQSGHLFTKATPVTVHGLLSYDDTDDEHGLYCDARKGKERMEVPLWDVEVKPEDPNHQLVSDYSFWLSNWR